MLLVLLVAGCGGGGPTAATRELVAWRLPKQAFIPHVELLRIAVHRRPAAAPAAAPSRPGSAPSASAGSDVSAGAPSDAQVKAELAQLYGKGGGASPGTARTVSLNSGLAQSPPDAPQAVQAIVDAANSVAKLPYVFGGGHGRGKGEGLWIDSAYDCSGSVSFALASAGLVKSPLDSRSLMRWGKPGRGRWVTIYASNGHAFMVIGGARFDTVGLRQSGSRWQPAYRSISGFVARHPGGL
jgi:cell wall-associated NlpC family hydrolase